MRARAMIGPILLLAALAGCSAEKLVCCGPGPATLRVVNAFTTPVDVLVDGQVAWSAVPAGAVKGVQARAGDHTLTFRPANAGQLASTPLTITAGAMSTVVAVRTSSGSVGTEFLDDTGSVVPAGATKVRVLHLAPNAGTLQVYRTQPDWQQPISWQFPFNYQAEITSLSAPFLQSTVGTWEIRIWQTPADSSGWSSAPVKVVIPLASGEKKTVVILDKDGGGVRTEVF